MKLEEEKRPVLSALQFDGEAEVLAFSCLASASLSVKEGRASPNTVAASIQMLPCGHLSILGHLSPLVWHWRGHTHQVTCREEWVISDDLDCTEASQHCGCKGFAPLFQISIPSAPLASKPP